MSDWCSDVCSSDRSLGDYVEVKVDDVDPSGKVSRSLAGEFEIPDSAVSSGGGDRDRGDRGGRSRDRDRAPRESAPAEESGDREVVSFEDAFDAADRKSTRQNASH